MVANACSPGFTNTRMCKGYTGTRRPKPPRLGASVFAAALFSPLGLIQPNSTKNKKNTELYKTGCFFKEKSKYDSPLNKAISTEEDWISMPKNASLVQ